MRIRKKPYARDELLSSSVFVDNPKDCKGKWNEVFPEKKPLEVEFGCGKGSFIAELSHREKDRNFIAVDIKNEMLLMAKRNIEKTFAENEEENVKVAIYNIEQIDEIFDMKDDIGVIYINFCNPWPKPRHNKHRLTHTRQLETYKTFLKPGAEIRFKTDDDELYRATTRYFEEAGFEIVFDSDDFSVKSFENNIQTEHERMFVKEGKPIKGIIARLKGEQQWED